MLRGPSISYAQTIDPAGGIWPTRDAAGKPLARPLDVSRELNSFQPITPDQALSLQPQKPLYSAQVANTKPPMALTPNGPIRQSIASNTHFGLTKDDAKRVRDGLKSSGIGSVRARIKGRAVVPASVMDKLLAINEAALKQMQTGRSRDHGREM